MADHNLPTTTSTYVNVLAQISARLSDIAQGLNSGTTSPTNLPNNSLRWNPTSKVWEIYNSGTTTWSTWTTSLNIPINGTIGATTPSTGAFTTLSTTGVASLAASSTVGGTIIAGLGNAQTFTATQTFSATTPIISSKIGPSSTQQHTLPVSTSDTIALLATAQTFTNKTYDSGILNGTFTGNYIASGQASFTNSTAPIITAKIGPNTTQQHALPAIASDTIALLAATQTFTNKTIGTGSSYAGTPIPLTYGGTGSTSALSARANLGLAIGTDVPAVDGTGASGTWGINISGTSSSAVSAGSALYLSTANWTVIESGGKLLFKYGSTTVASMSSTGLITSASNIVANGTP